MLSRSPKVLLIAVGVLICLAGASFFVWRSQHLKSLGALVTVGMSRADVEAILGPPPLELDRQGGRGVLTSWYDNFWQFDVLFDRNGQVESVRCVPSESLYNHTIRWLNSLFK